MPRIPRHHDVDRLTVSARGAEPLAGNEAAVASQRLSPSGGYSHRHITVPRYYRRVAPDPGFDTFQCGVAIYYRMSATDRSHFVRGGRCNHIAVHTRYPA